ncbi:MAG: putative metal-binding motif-containing protein, partial [Chitinophagales bacterium]
NYLDDDCDGLADENLTYILSYQDNDGDAFGNLLIDSLSCELPIGYVEDNTDCDDTNPDIFPGATEILNGLDDDCDQIADEGLTIENLNNIICSISPNPSFDIINIVSNISGNGLYEIISATGQVVLYGDWDATNISISIIDIPSGIYNIRLSIYETLLSLTFIKIN